VHFDSFSVSGCRASDTATAASITGADVGAAVEVTLHVAPIAGDCASGVTALAITNVGPFTVT
jgi:hypothetical protein